MFGVVERRSWPNEVIDDFYLHFIANRAFKNTRRIKRRRGNITRLVFMRLLDNTHIDLKWEVRVFQRCSVDIPKRLLVVIPGFQNGPRERACICDMLFTLITHLEIEVIKDDGVDRFAAAADAAASGLRIHFLCKDHIFLIRHIRLTIILDVVDAMDFCANKRQLGLPRFLVDEFVLYFQRISVLLLNRKPRRQQFLNHPVEVLSCGGFISACSEAYL